MRHHAGSDNGDGVDDSVNGDGGDEDEQDDQGVNVDTHGGEHWEDCNEEEEEDVMVMVCNIRYIDMEQNLSIQSGTHLYVEMEGREGLGCAQLSITQVEDC